MARNCTQYRIRLQAFAPMATYRSPKKKLQYAIVRPMEEKFGPILRKLRNDKGLSQHDLAAKLEISRSHIGRLETGEKQPSLAMLFRLAAALGVPASAIIAAMEKSDTSSDIL